MHMTKVPVLLLVILCCELCLTIKVPLTWEDSNLSDVKNDPREASSLPSVNPQTAQVTRIHNEEPIPDEYFEYTAKKPQFAADIAAFHGVKNPDQHYKAYPVKPFTGAQKPALGIHYMIDEDKRFYQPSQFFLHPYAGTLSDVKPTTSEYEVFHPYKAEEPALQEIYADPVLTNIRKDIQDSKNRLQTYEQQAGEPNIAKGEYLESPKKTEKKLFPHKNKPVRYEIHRPERRPVYYKVPVRDFIRNNILNKQIKHPLHQNAKIKPVHYHPLHNHIHNLKQHHAMKYDDERNEYPQVPISEEITENEDGYDIYERAEEKYTQLRNNLDESIAKVSQENRAPSYQKLELQKQEPKNEDIEEEFVPVKNYAQVRKTETFKHLPKKAAFDDAETFEEVINAPRLRQAVKSSKAQTVYTEEGYEDSAYDHAGERKHASDHEGHGGFLKAHENSAGLYKIPTVSAKFQEGRGSKHRHHKEHGKKWKNDDKDNDEHIESEDYSEIEEDESDDSDIYKNSEPKADTRHKRHSLTYIDVSKDDSNEDIDINGNEYDSDGEIEDDRSIDNIGLQTRIMNSDEFDTHQEIGKRHFKVLAPQVKLNSTLLIRVPKHVKQYNEHQVNIKEKYSYYFKNIKGINNNSPLRYAENLKFIPKKSNGGTEFYNSRSRFECPEVDSDVDPLPEKLKNGENPSDEDDDEEGETSETNKKKGFGTITKQPRLKGLGDKIDCFKAKYFGENPLDSPFFNEDIISNPEPIFDQESKLNTSKDSFDKLQKKARTNIFNLLNKLKSDEGSLVSLQDSLNKTNEELKTFLNKPSVDLVIQVTNDTKKENSYNDILKNININTKNPENRPDLRKSLLNSNTNNSNITYGFFQNKEEITKLPSKLRKKRATSFVYEPYKIIRDSQVPDSKKTTTTSNISPLIKQLQSSGLADRVSKSNKDDKQVKQKTNSRTYVDIGKRERAKSSTNENDNSDATFVDVSVDHRRGEPRYELRPPNHKSEYTPVKNKRAMSVDAYNSHKTTESNIKITTTRPARGKQRSRFLTSSTTARPYYDESQYNPSTTNTQNVAASNAVKNTVASANHETVTKLQEKNEEHSEEEINGEEYDDEDEEEVTTTTTTTTTHKPLFRRKLKVTEATVKIPERTTEAQRLKLVTRFRNYKPNENSETKEKIDDADDIVIPSYREKKKNMQTRTVVRDTKKYGDDNDDNMSKEVDAMIGVKHDMNDYMPMYEKEKKNKENLQRTRKRYDISEESYDGADDSSDDTDDVDDYDDTNDGDDADDDDDNGGDSINGDDDEEELDIQLDSTEVTTPEPTKRTLVRTTDAPPSTLATRISTTTSTVPSSTVIPKTKPVVTRKKIEIHRMLPINKSSPNVTQFKEDIKEVEIIKEMPAMATRKPSKHVLDLYKDDDLAKAINDLGVVEIFKEEFDLDRAPRHGGNYRQATKEDLRLLKPQEDSTIRPKDAEPSQSENSKFIERDQHKPKRLHGVNTKLVSDIKRSKNSGRSSELTDLSKPPVTGMHGGNLKHENARHNGRRNEKLLELEGDNEDQSQEDNDYTYKSHNSRNEKMHGGNYRSAELDARNENNDDTQVKRAIKNTRSSSAGLLNSFARVIPILTSTPGYIVDPSKRMYYYVDA